MNASKDLYFVAVKVFLEDEGGNFLITKDKFGDWDIPGGRLRVDDFTQPFDKILHRKVIEELGSIEYKLGEPVVFFRHERNEILPTGERDLRRIFAIGYRAKYLVGEITLGTNHECYKWVSKLKFKPEEYFTDVWLQGVKEYQAKIGAEN